MGDGVGCAIGCGKCGLCCWMEGGCVDGWFGGWMMMIYVWVVISGMNE